MNGPLTTLRLCDIAGCTRPARWVIRGRTHDEIVVTTVVACDWHLDTARWQVWTFDNQVVLVSTRLMSKDEVTTIDERGCHDQRAPGVER